MHANVNCIKKRANLQLSNYLSETQCCLNYVAVIKVKLSPKSNCFMIEYESNLRVNA